VVSPDCRALGMPLGTLQFHHHYGTQGTILAVHSAEGDDVVGPVALSLHTLHVGDILLVHSTAGAAGPSLFIGWASIVGQGFFAVDTKVDGNAETGIPSLVAAALSTDYIPIPAWFPECVVCRCCVSTSAPMAGGDQQGGAAQRYIKLPYWWPNMSLLVFLGVVVAAMAEQSLVLAAAIAIIAMVVLRLVTVPQCIKYVDWTVYCTGAFAFGIGYGMTESGLAAVIGKLLVDANVSGFPLLLLLHVLSGLLANIISNRGAIQIMFPIVLSIFRAQGWELTPAAVIIANASVAGLMTSFGLSPSLIITAPGRYTAFDFMKFGTPLFILYALLSAVVTCAVYDFW